MPLCKENHKDEGINQTESCFEEHELGNNKYLLCGDYIAGQLFLEDEQVNLYPKKDHKDNKVENGYDSDNS